LGLYDKCSCVIIFLASFSNASVFFILVDLIIKINPQHKDEVDNL
jgi:hypothetical protein